MGPGNRATEGRATRSSLKTARQASVARSGLGTIMKALLLGASGGCGSQVLVRLLDRGVATTVIIRDEQRLPNIAKGHALLTVVVEKQGHLQLHKHVSGGGNPHVAFCAVRPSDLKDDDASEFTLHATLQNGIFNAGSTRRANVGEFMADLVTKPAVWAEWKNSYPQILDVVVPDPTKAKPKAR